MTRLRVLVSRLLDLVLRGGRDRRLKEELQAHLDQLTEDHIARGLPPDEARLAARKTFGGVDQIKEVYRDQRGVPLLHALTQDVRLGFRLLGRDRGFALTAVLVLGVGIGVNNLFFTVVYGHTMRGMPMAAPERVLSIQTVDQRGAERGLSAPEVADLRAGTRNFRGFAVFAVQSVSVADPGRPPDRLLGAYVSADAFAAIGVQPLLGRSFRADDGAGGPAVALVGEGAWQARYGGDPGTLGRSILINGTPTTLVGVMPDRSGFPSSAEVWLPLTQMPGMATAPRDARTLTVAGRVRDEASVADARLEAEALIGRFAVDHAATNSGIRARVMTIDERFFPGLYHPAWIAFLSAGFLIAVIACANVANLMLSRSLHRARELAIRTSLGASRLRLIRQLLVESTVLAVLGGLLGLGLGVLGVRAYAAVIPRGLLGYWVHYSLDTSILAMLIFVSMATVFVFGLVPALYASKTDVNAVLKDGGRASASARSLRRWTTAFMTAELAVTVVLLTNNSMSLGGRTELPSDVAVDTANVLTASISLPVAAYSTPERRAAFHTALLERIAALPGVGATALSTHLPMGGAADRYVEVEGDRRAVGETGPSAGSIAVSPGFFETIALPPIRGRDFAAADGAPGELNVIVNERFVEMFLDGDQPLGRRVALRIPGAAAEPAWHTIVGVAPTIRRQSGTALDPIVYQPIRQSAPAAISLVVRGGADMAALTESVRKAVLGLDPNLPVFRAMTLRQSVREADWSARVSVSFVLLLTVLAVVLSTVGLYAITAQAVSQRTPEIGLRIALGAEPSQVGALVLGRAFVQLAMGFVFGVVCTAFWDRMFVPAEAATRLVDPLTLSSVAVMLVVVMAVACVVPVRRAARLDPVAALREQ